MSFFVKRFARPRNSILVVDNDLQHSNPLVHTLRQNGAVVYEVANSDEALSAIADHTEISIAVIDLRMPTEQQSVFSVEETGDGAFTGLALAKSIETSHPDMIFYMYSALPGNDQVSLWEKGNPKRRRFYSKSEMSYMIQAITDLIYPKSTKSRVMQVRTKISYAVSFFTGIIGILAFLGFSRLSDIVEWILSWL